MVNDTDDFDMGRRLKNLDDLKRIGFAANRRLLRVQQVSHDCAIGAGTFDDLHRPRLVDGQRASALRFGDPRVQALLAALLAFRVPPNGFRNRDLRGLIERIPFTRYYRVTDDGLRTALCYHRTYGRVLRPAMSVVFDAPPRSASRLNRAVDSFDREIQRLWEGYDLAA